jgi:LmbE family N-acetylglucosaminyl deacetylase
MKLIKNVLLLCLVALSISVAAQDKPLQIIVFGAHPDDCDLDAGGTAILLAKMGHHVKFVSMTNGDAGHQSMGGGALAKRRTVEAIEAGKRFGVEYTVLDNHDGELLPTLENRLKVIREIRKWNADVVISHRTNDYHPDHRYTGTLVQDAAYMIIVPNVAPDTPPLKKNPVFLYLQDNFKTPNPFKPDISVDIDEVKNQKVYAFSAHESQFYEWLPWTSGEENEVPKSEKERLAWLTEKWMNTPITDAVRENLKKWYGDEHAAKVKNAEAFQICEYGSQPDDKQIIRLFPMLKPEK